MKKKLATYLFALSLFLMGQSVDAQSQPWTQVGGVLKTSFGNPQLQVQQLGGSGTQCIQVSNTGVFSVSGTGACGSGSSTGWSTTSQDYYSSLFRDLSVQGNGYLAPTTTRGLIFTASSTISLLTSKYSTSTSATTTALYVSGDLWLNAERFSDLTGTGLSNVGGVLTNSGVTSIVAGSNISISGATGAVTITGLATSSVDFYNSLFKDWRVDSTGALTPTTSRAILVNNGTSTITNLQVVNGTTTNATTTNLTISSLSDGCLSTVSGKVTSSGSACGSAAGIWGTTSQDFYMSLFKDWKVDATGALIPTTSRPILVNNASSTITNLTVVNGTTTNATSTTVFATSSIALNSTTTNSAYFTSGLQAQGSSTITRLQVVNGTTTNATSTNLYVSGDFWLNAERFTDLTGTGLSNTAGVLTNSGVTSVIAGSNISVSAATGAVTITGLATSSMDFYNSLFKDWRVDSTGALVPTTSRPILVNNGTSTITNLQIVNGTTTNATSTNLLVSSDFWLNSERFTDLTGTGLSNSAGVLTNSGVISASCTGAICSGTNPLTVNIDGTSQFRDWKIDSGGNLVPTTTRAILIQGQANNIGLGTTSPWGVVSVGSANAAASTIEPLFVVASSSSALATTTALIIDSTGDLGIGGTTSPGTLFSLGNTGNDTINIVPTATSTFGSGINLRTGCFAINGTCVAGSGGSGTVTSVGLSLPTGFTITNSPVTTSGTLTGNFTSSAFTIRKLPTYIVGASGADFTTIQAAMTQAGADGGATIYLTDTTYAQGGTGLTFRGSNTNIYCRTASTTITFTGATTLFKTNSAAGAYGYNGVHGCTITGDGNTGSIVFDVSDMSHMHISDNIIDNVGKAFRANDTQDVSFYGVYERNTATTITSIGFDASSTNPWNGNMVTNNFIGCSSTNCINFQINNGNGNSFVNNFAEPSTSNGTVGFKIFDNLLSSNDGVFNNVFSSNYVEANGTGFSIAATVDATGGGIKRNRFSNNTVEANTLDWAFPNATSSVIALNTFDNNYDSNFGNPLTSFQGPFGVGTSTQMESISTTPWAYFGVSAQAGVALNRVAFGSSTETNFIINDSGNIGFATTSPTVAKFSVEQGTEKNSVWVGNQGSTTPSFVINGVNGNGNVGIGTSTPFTMLSVGAGRGSSTDAILVSEHRPGTTTSFTIDWRNGNTQNVRMGNADMTISFTGYTDGQVLKVLLCNPPTGTSGAITWGTQVLWAGGTVPTKTTTANKCDVYSFLATQATSTLKIFGTQSANF